MSFEACPHAIMYGWLFASSWSIGDPIWKKEKLNNNSKIGIFIDFKNETETWIKTNLTENNEFLNALIEL